MMNTKSVDEAVLIERVAELAGMTEIKDARRAISATLAALAERMPRPEKDLLAEAIPDRWAEMVATTEQGGAVDVEDLVIHVQRREAVPFGFAREHTQVVFRVLAELLPETLLAKLGRALPDDIASLFRRPEPPAPPPPHPTTRREREHHTLATGKAGSHHPLSESAPVDAHSGSVARTDNPHADTKLSSAEGMTQERLHESLATSEEDDDRTIANASDS
jgi:uncharacterized protein (DUF2267 family)